MAIVMSVAGPAIAGLRAPLSKTAGARHQRSAPVRHAVPRAAAGRATRAVKSARCELGMSVGSAAPAPRLRALPSQPRQSVVTHASAAGVVEQPDDKSEDAGRSMRVAASLGGWFFLNAVFAIMNKKTLSCFPYPWLLSWIQIATGAVFMLVMWRLNVFKPPEGGGLTLAQCKALIPTSILHLIAHVSACASYNLSSVSFMQVVKAAEPACSVILLTMFFGAKYSKWVWLSLVPIVCGVMGGSATEINFSMAAFLLAMTSNLACALRGVTSKNMQNEIGLRGINLYAGIAIVSSIILLPLCLIVEGAHLSAAFAAAPALLDAKGILLFGMFNVGFTAYLLVGSLFYHLYNQTSYQALAEMSPLTHSVANTVKRVVIILASVAVFRNPITPAGAIAAAIAISGTFLYSLARQHEAKQLAEKKEA